MSGSSRQTREKAAAARAEAQKAERARRRRTNMLMGGGVLVAVALIIGGVVLATRQGVSSASATTLPAANPDAALPSTVLSSSSSQPYGVPTGAASSTTSTVVIWEDFQCPVCAQFEALQGAAIRTMAQEGKIFLVHRPATFIDAKAPESGLSSARATSAWGCAIDAGVGEQFHSSVFAHQPAKEGTGWTDEQLAAFGRDAGLTGAAYDTFASCVTAHTYLGWAANSEQEFLGSGIPGTPTVVLDGREMPSTALATAADWIEQNRTK
jgi:protein-disulfide isomerase